MCLADGRVLGAVAAELNLIENWIHPSCSLSLLHLSHFDVCDVKTTCSTNSLTSGIQQVDVFGPISVPHYLVLPADSCKKAASSCQHAGSHSALSWPSSALSGHACCWRCCAGRHGHGGQTGQTRGPGGLLAVHGLFRRPRSFVTAPISQRCGSSWGMKAAMTTAAELQM